MTFKTYKNFYVPNFDFSSVIRIDLKIFIQFFYWSFKYLVCIKNVTAELHRRNLEIVNTQLVSNAIVGAILYYLLYLIYSCVVLQEGQRQHSNRLFQHRFSHCLFCYSCLRPQTYSFVFLSIIVLYSTA